MIHHPALLRMGLRSKSKEKMPAEHQRENEPQKRHAAARTLVVHLCLTVSGATLQAVLTDYGVGRIHIQQCQDWQILWAGGKARSDSAGQGNRNSAARNSELVAVGATEHATSMYSTGTRHGTRRMRVRKGIQRCLSAVAGTNHSVTSRRICSAPPHGVCMYTGRWEMPTDAAPLRNAAALYF